MPQDINRQFLISARPDGQLKESDFKYVETRIPEPGEGEVLVKVLVVAVEPALRGSMVEDKSNPTNLQIGDVMRALAAGQVVESNNPDVPTGTFVQGLFGFADYVVVHPKAFLFAPIPEGVSLEEALYVFDTSGLTAYLGMMTVCKPQPGENVLVSAAAGAVGSLAIQMAKIAGSKTVGIAGSADKCQWLVDELAADGAINYKTDDIPACIKSFFPGGIDCYFDNVGGEILDAALGQLRLGSRVAMCGRISEYADTGPAYEPINSANMVNNCVHMERLMLFDHTAQFKIWRDTMASWISEGKLQCRVDMLEGFEHLPKGLVRLFSGENTGKQLIRIGKLE